MQQMLAVSVFLLAIGVAEGMMKPLKYADIIDSLKDKSDPDMIPIDDSDPKPVEVTLSNSLVYIISADDEAEVVDLVILQTESWRHAKLAWNPSHSENVENVTLALRHLWTPDLTLINPVSAPETLSPEMAIISADGTITYKSQMRISIHADLTGLSTPAGARITIPYESWTHDSTRLTLSSPPESKLETDEFESNRYVVSEPSVVKSSRELSSRLHQHDLLAFSFTLKRKE